MQKNLEISQMPLLCHLEVIGRMGREPFLAGVGRMGGICCVSTFYSAGFLSSSPLLMLGAWETSIPVIALDSA